MSPGLLNDVLHNPRAYTDGYPICVCPNVDGKIGIVSGSSTSGSTDENLFCKILMKVNRTLIHILKHVKFVNTTSNTRIEILEHI